MKGVSGKDKLWQGVNLYQLHADLKIDLPKQLANRGPKQRKERKRAHPIITYSYMSHIDKRSLKRRASCLWLRSALI